MSADPKRGTAPSARDVVSRLGTIVKERVREFATEADEHLRETLGQARDELDAELAGGRKRVDPAVEEPDDAPSSDAKP